MKPQDELMDVVHRQRVNMAHLLGIVTAKQLAFGSSDSKALTDLITREEKVLQTIQETERLRLRLMQALVSELEVDVRSDKLPKLSVLLDGRINAESMARLMDDEHELRRLITEVTEVNQRNLFIIRHMRKFVGELVNAIVGNKDRSIVDVKM